MAFVLLSTPKNNRAKKKWDWLKEGTKFWYVECWGEVRSDLFGEIRDTDNALKKMGNCFRTKREALAWREKVKKLNT